MQRQASASSASSASSRKASLATCILCCNAIDNAERFHTVGACGHTGCCSVCALRMRQLMGSMSCAVCKQELPRVICVEREGDAFESFQDWGDDNIGPTHVFDEPSAMFFLKQDFQTHVRKLRDPLCAKCGKKFATVQSLKTHVLDVHQLQFCGICLEFKKIFLGEHSLFTKEQLKKHNTRGDPKEGFTGHPRCDFCFSRHYSTAELYDHLHKNHFECDICLHSMHIENRYYKNYPDLENHFRADHFLCEEPPCLAKKFVVFKSHIDLQGHMAKEHPHIKTSRKIDVHFKVRRAVEDSADDPYDTYGRQPSNLFSANGNSNEINVADFPSLSEGGGQSSGSLFWENHSTTRPRSEDFPALQSATTGGRSVGGGSAFRNALVPPPSAALQAHLDHSNNWEYPELANAAAALGANNPLMRFVKPAKKNKKGKKGGGGSGGGGTRPASAGSASAAAVDEYEDKVAVAEDADGDDEEEEELASSEPLVSKSELVLKINRVLGSNAKYEVFREDCKAFRMGDADLPAFYKKMRDLFSPEDFEKLFLKLMRLFPDKEQIDKFFAYHKQMTKASARADGFQDSSSKKSKQKKAPAKQAPKAAAKKAPSPSHLGWSSALRDAGVGSGSKSNGRGPSVIVHNTDTRNILGRDDKPKGVWASSTSWQAPVSAAAPAPAVTPVTTKIQTAPIDSFAALSVATTSTPSASYANSVAAGGSRPGSAPSGSFKTAKSDFPELPKASKPIGVQPVTRATWDDHVQTIAQNRPASAQGNGKKKQKKKSMTLAEMAMHFG